ncbi:hypothetical protein K438DRAFT_1863480 [Mycena galopus ATCC 62051]|nr:hypothetical protein K438DRAFT_1863480 [Mycena galopus ATCC 62051]
MKAGRRRAPPTPSPKSHTMTLLPDVSLSYGPVLIVFLGQVLTYYQQYRRTITHGCDILYMCIVGASAEACTPSSFIRTSEAMESSIRALLQPSDTVKVVLEALVVPPANDTEAPDPLSPSPILLRNRRVLAVVAHSDGPNTQEEGSGFILKAKPTSGCAFEQSDILRVFPIFGGFLITMAQVRRETWPCCKHGLEILP